METAASPPYKHLDPSTSEIRLLEVPSDGSKDWGLVTVSLDDNPEYAALSYVWGEKEDLRNINVQGQNAKADAICINQEDDEERSQQVKLMYRIFSCAQTVYSWVGPNDYSLAFQAIKTLAHEVARNRSNNTIHDGHDDSARTMHVPPFEIEWLRHHPSLCDEPTGTSPYDGNYKVDAMTDLLADPYWQRVWIFQESVLARQLNLVSSGSIILSWQNLSVAAESFYNLNLRWQVGQNLLQRPDFLPEMTWTHLAQFLKVDHAHWDTAALASWLIATDPKDYIYGLLAISRIPITPDYSKDVAEVYADFVERWMETAKQNGVENFNLLGFLAVAGAGAFKPTYNFPSWAPNFPENGRSDYKVHFDSSMSGKIFRGEPSKCPYLAKNTGSLFVWGAEIEPVLHVFKPCPDEDLDRQLCDLGFFLRDYTSRHSHYI
ncbi:hypothetical protein CEP53_009839 [Fusarium sp. AF-6]|nr:hypothetical protein CEP53_009839 [Fusarium sp. AF-6]